MLVCGCGSTSYRFHFLSQIASSRSLYSKGCIIEQGACAVEPHSTYPVRQEGKMYCPKCGYEYRDGFSRCSDCGSALVSEPPKVADKKKHEEPPTENVEFVVVMRTGRLWEVEMVENAFTKAKIPHYQQSESSSGLVLAKQLAPAMGPGEWWSFYVPKSFQPKAEEIFKTLPIEVTVNPDVWHFNPPEDGKWFFKNYAKFYLLAMLITLILFIIHFLKRVKV